MKKLFLLFMVSMLTISYTIADPSSKNYFEQKKSESKLTIKKELNTTVRNLNYYADVQHNNNELKAKAEKKRDNDKNIFSLQLENFSGLQDFKKARNVKELITKYQLDSVIFVDEFGENIWMVKLSYNENYLPATQLNLMWDGQQYNLGQEFNYEWNNAGYLITESVIYYDEFWGNSGLKYHYYYNAQNLCNAQVRSWYENDDWALADSTTLQYDERGNPIELHGFEYQGSSWFETRKEFADYDSYNRQNLYEGYYWEDTQWVGSDKLETTWLPTGEDLITLIIGSMWSENNQWEYFKKTEQDWNATIQLTLQAFSYWNSETGDWSGNVEDDWGWMLYNQKTVLTYDAEEKQTYELFSELKGANWIPAFEFEFDWDTHAGTNELQMNRRGYNYNEDGTSKDYVSDYWARYSNFFPVNIAVRQGKFTYRMEARDWFGYGWENDYEEVYEYDNQGRQLKEIHWTFMDNEKFADISEELIYDDNDNIIKSIYHMGQYTGEDDWVLAATFLYEYDQYNYEIRRHRYAGETLTPDWGYGVDFDYDVPASLVISFPENDYDPFKILYLYEFVGNGANFDEQVKTFYYSEKEVESVDEIVKNKNVTIYPNPTLNTITIKTSDELVQVQIYNILGVKVLQTTDKNIDLSNFPSGIYVVDVNGTKMKVVKK